MPFQNFQFFVPKTTDQQVVKALLNGAIECGFSVVELSVSTALGKNYKLKVSDGKYDLHSAPQIEECLTLESSLINSFTLIIHANANVSYTRRLKETTDQVAFNFQNWSQEPANSESLVTHFLQLVKTELKSVDTEAYLSSILSESLQGHYLHREAELNKLINMSETVTVKASEYREQLNKDYQNKEQALRDDYKKQREELQTEYDRRRQELTNKEEELNTTLKEFDDRENRHVRREIREALLTNLKARQEKFSLTDGTKKLRWPIYGAVGVVIFVLAWANWKTFGLFDNLDKYNGYQLAFLVAKQSALALAFGSTVVFFFRWCNHWFQQHANEEFYHKRLELDIDRASWVVEMALEWKTSTTEEIPTELLNKLSAELFNDQCKEVDQQLHPADQLASALLGASAQTKLKIGDNEITLDKKGIQALIKQELGKC